MADQSGYEVGEDQGRELSRSAIAVLAAALRRDQDALKASLKLVPSESMATALAIVSAALLTEVYGSVDAALGAVGALGLRMGGER
ncbi:MAG: hypothetical protein NVSMB32_14990 [Actinomycetota bacterium]